MSSATRSTLNCIVLLLVSAFLAHAQTAPVKEPTSTVSGRVTIKGKAVAGIVIGLRVNQHTPMVRAGSYKGTTDENGEYHIVNVPAGNYLIAPLAPAFIDSTGLGQPRTLIVSKGETVEHIDFALVRGGVITGKVVDADGRPVVEEEVRIFLADENHSYPTTQTQTDDRGIYRAYGLKAGNYKVAAGQGDEGSLGNYRGARYKRTFHPAVFDIAEATVIELSEGGEATNVDITLGRNLTTYTASGRIVDAETGQPITNVNYGVVHIISQYSRSSMSNGAVSNSRGEFKLDNLLPGKYAVFLRPGPNSNWHAEEVPFEIVDDDVTGLVVQTKKGATISGVVVVEGSGEKIGRDELRRTALSVWAGQQGGSSSWTTIAPDGTFTVSGLAAGTVQFQIGNSQRFRIMRIERNATVQAPRSIEVRDGENITGVRIVVAYGNASIRGSIEITSGTPPPGARFFVWLRNVNEDPTAASIAVDVDARGQFVVEGLLPGTYEVNAGVSNPEARVSFGVKRQQIEVSAGSVNNLTVYVEVNPNPAKP